MARALARVVQDRVPRSPIRQAIPLFAYGDEATAPHELEAVEMRVRQAWQALVQRMDVAREASMQLIEVRARIANVFDEEECGPRKEHALRPLRIIVQDGLEQLLGS